MSMKEIREQSAVILSAVDGVGVVHQYTRLATDWKQFLSLFRDSEGRINTWSISREKTIERQISFDGDVMRGHHFIIRGIYGLKDAAGSELVFQDTIELICETFRGNDDLNGSCFSTAPTLDGENQGNKGIQVMVVEHRNFGGELCHYCELGLYAEENIE